MPLNTRSIIRDLAGDLLYATGITRPSKKSRKHAFHIVTFHRVLPAEQQASYPITEITVTPEELTWFVRFFKQYFQCGTLSENYAVWQSEEYSNRPLLCITFDDGQLDNYLYARPILNSAKIPATFFVTSNGMQSDDTLWYDRMAYAIVKLYKQMPVDAQTRLASLGIATNGSAHEATIDAIEQAKSIHTNKRNLWIEQLEKWVGGAARPAWDGMMNQRQLSKLVQEGHEIGSHSLSHPILPLCDDAELEDEISLSRKILQDELDTPIQSFCYPNGDADKRTNDIVKAAGYPLAVTTQWGGNKPGAAPLALKRFDIQAQTSRCRNGHLSAARLAWRLSPYFPIRM